MNEAELQASRLEGKEAHLRQLVAAEPDAVRVEFKRRQDCAEALRDRMVAEWEARPALIEAHKKLLGSKAIQFILALFLIAGLVTCESSTYRWYGLVVMLFSGFWYTEVLLRSLQASIDIKLSEARLTEYFTQWKSLSHSDDYPGTLKKSCEKRRSLDEDSKDTDDWRAQSNALDFQMWNEWLNAQYKIFNETRIKTRWQADNWQSRMP